MSILVAAGHAVRPLFPGREPLVAGLFGLVHGLAFSGTLTELDLSGGELVRSLLGFNVGIELMQLDAEIAAALVLSPLTVKTHVNRAMAKVGARDRAQLVVLAYRTGLVHPRMRRPGSLD